MKGATRLCLCLATILTAGALKSHAQNFSPYSAFQNLSQSDLQHLKVKLTYVGIAEKPIKSVLLKAAADSADIAVFTQFQRPNISYIGDSVTPRLADVSPGEFQTMLTQSLPPLPSVTAGGVAQLPQISFSMVASSPALIGFESVLDINDGRALITALRSVLASNQAAMKAINLFACAAAVSGTGTPVNVTSSVTTSVSGLRLNRTTGRYSATLSVKNNTASPITGPINAIISFAGSVRLFNSFGYTCQIPPEGQDVMSVAVSTGSLAPGATLQVPLDIVNPANEPVQPTITVYAGSTSI